MENSWPVGRTMNVFPVECVSLYVHTRMNMYAYTQTHIQSHMLVHMYTQTSIHACTQHTPSVSFVSFSFRLRISPDLNLFFLADHSSVLYSLGVWLQG